jgi:DNA-binding CsgD family transcriptional regulator
VREVAGVAEVAAASQAGSGARTVELPDGVSDVVQRSPLPALILEVPSERIVVANPAAREMLAPDGDEVVGSDIESFTADASPGVLELLIAGRLNGYETVRQFRLKEGSTVPAQVWVRGIGEEIPPRHVLVVVMEGARPAGGARPSLPQGFKVVIGTTDVNLRIDRVSSDVSAILGREPTELIGQALFGIVHPDDLAGLMWALAQSTATGKGVSLQVHLDRAAGQAQLCQALLLPMDPLLPTDPLPSFAFALFPSEPTGGSPGPDVERLLWETRRGIEAVGSSRDLAGLTEAQVPGLSELTSRELHVVTRLLAGNRVPAIAKALFISQSTVRNHLSSVFRKLGVESQQELIDLLASSKDATSGDK